MKGAHRIPSVARAGTHREDGWSETGRDPFAACRKFCGAVATVVALVASSARGHEGHKPLPANGVEVDVAQGTITLSVKAHRSLGLQTAVVAPDVIEDKALAYATLVTPWQQQHFVGSQLPGRIAVLHVVTGEAVEPGRLLAEIVSPELQAVELALRNAVNALALSTRQAARLRGLFQNQAVPERELIEANSQYQQDKNAVQIARSKLLSLGLGESAINESLDTTHGELRVPLLSPIQGVVSHADLAVGKVVAAHEHLFEVTNLSNLWVRIGVLERDIPRVKVGQRVELELAAFPTTTLDGVVTVPVVEVDPLTHVATAWAEIANPPGSPKYLPGMHGTARIVTSEARSSTDSPLLSVPAAALLGSAAERYVLVEVAATSKGHEYRRQNVVLAARNSSFVQIESGSLFPGDRVVSVGGQVLSSFFILESLRLSQEGIRNVGLKVEPVGLRVVEEVLRLDGVTDLPPDRVASVSSQLAGTLARIHVDRGQKVAAGQLLAEVLSLQLQSSQLELLKSDLDAELLAETLRQMQSKGQTPIVAGRRIAETESARDAALNRRQSARQSLITSGLTAEEVDQVLATGLPRAALPIRSPMAGVVVRFEKVLGQGIAADEPVFEVHDLSQPWAKAFLSEREAPRVPIGTPTRVRLLSHPDFVANGTVTRSARMLGTQDRALAVWIEFSDLRPELLPRNLLASISATIRRPDATLAVPRSALIREQARSYVFVEQQGGLLERRHVVPGRSDDRYVEIRDGLTIGEAIAVQGVAELQTTYASVR